MIMVMSGDPVTRYELDDLRRTVERNQDRLDSIEQARGGFEVLTVQISELAKDLAKHEERHEQADARRASGRKWWWMAVIALVGAIDGPLVTLILQHGH